MFHAARPRVAQMGVWPPRTQLSSAWAWVKEIEDLWAFPVCDSLISRISYNFTAGFEVVKALVLGDDLPKLGDGPTEVGHLILCGASKVDANYFRSSTVGLGKLGSNTVCFDLGDGKNR